MIKDLKIVLILIIGLIISYILYNLFISENFANETSILNLKIDINYFFYFFFIINKKISKILNFNFNFLIT